MLTQEMAKAWMGSLEKGQRRRRRAREDPRRNLWAPVLCQVVCCRWMRGQDPRQVPGWGLATGSFGPFPFSKFCRDQE